ncbi:MAG: hypothetical protein H6617_07670 [Bdellovibrionaceae bacterium]|nr:hypothetical protein [Pseudobdellovibrionaceae bacterium]
MMWLKGLFKFYERIGIYFMWLTVTIFHVLLLWDVGQYVVDDENWQPHFVGDVESQVQATLKKIDFVEKQNLSDERFRAALVRRAAEDCNGCGLNPFPGKEKSLAILKALGNPDVRQRYEFWHSLSMLAWMLFWCLNLLLLAIAMGIPSGGVLRYFITATFLIPFLTLLAAATTASGDILNFVDDVPTFVGLGKYLLYFSAGFPLVGWPLALGMVQWMRVNPSAGRSKLPNPYNYRPPKERMRKSGR